MSKKQVRNTQPAKPAGMKKLEHRGYVIVQSPRNNHVMIGKDGRTVYHASYDRPCQGCPDRYLACSDHCTKPEFIAWKEEQARIREAKRRESEILGYTANEIRKNRRIRK